MQTAMRPQIGIQRAPPPWPVAGQMVTTSQGFITRGGSLQAAVMPGPTIQSGFAARGAHPGISAPLLKSAQPAGQAVGFQASTPAPANYTPIMRTTAAPAGVQKPATLSAFTASSTAPSATAPMSSMAPASRGASTRVTAGVPTGLMMRSAPTTSGGYSAGTLPRAPKAFTGSPLIMNSENQYPRIVPSEKVDKVGPVGQSPLPLRPRNVADPGSMAPVSSPMVPQRLLMPTRTPIAPRHMSSPAESKLEPPRSSDLCEPPKAVEFIQEIQEPSALLPQQQQPLKLPAPPQAATLEEFVVNPADCYAEFRDPQGAYSSVPLSCAVAAAAAEPPPVREAADGTNDGELATSSGFQWQLINAHPMVMEEEKAFISEALQELSVEIERFGGIAQYMFSNYADYVSETMPVEELLQLALLACFQEKSRNGQDTINIQIGSGFSMGMKKVVKLDVQLQEPEVQQLVRLAILWEWDVKLEWRGSHADE